MNADTEARLAYLARTVDLLWPDAPNGTSMVVLPTCATPRLLAPTRPRRAAAAAVLRYTAQQSRRDRAAGALLAAAVAAGYARTRPPVRSDIAEHGAESIDDHLARVLGHPVVSSLALTHDRPNRKPVLQVFDRRGRTVAFAKIGVTDLTATLVRAEAGALHRLAEAGLRAADVPRVLSDDTWKGHCVLVASALPSGAAITTSTSPLGAAMREVSAAGEGSLAGYLDSLRTRAVAARAAAPDDDTCRVDAIELWQDTFERLITTRELDRLPIGAWHGDWTPWNCSRRSGRISVWDWERFAVPAPHGFDMLHFALNRDIGGDHRRFRAVASALVGQSDVLLRPWRLAGSDAQVVVLLYLLDIALRYLHDDTRSTDPGGRVEDWALPIVRSHLGLTVSR